MVDHTYIRDIIANCKSVKYVTVRRKADAGKPRAYQFPPPPSFPLALNYRITHSIIKKSIHIIQVYYVIWSRRMLYILPSIRQCMVNNVSYPYIMAFKYPLTPFGRHYTMCSIAYFT